jgi:hypothetical protein
MANASTLTRWVPRLIVGIACLGHLAHWVIRRTGRIPALPGWWTLGLTVLSLVLLPASGLWLALGAGIPTLVAARRDDTAAALPTP